MGLQHSRQLTALPKPQVEDQQEAAAEPCYDGLIPRSLTARQACNARRVRRLIEAGRLAPCYEADLQGVEGEECPVCMEQYRRVNNTACCHQNICTECFISVVAPSGVSSRCPYCQAQSLQVYLQLLPCCPDDCEAAAGAPAEDALGAAAAAAGEPATAEPAPPSRPPSSMGAGSNGMDSGSAMRAASTASSSLSMASMELNGDSVPVTALLAPTPSAATRTAVEQCHEALGRGCSPNASSCSGLQPASLPLKCDLQRLAQMAAEASRAEGPAIVAMVRRADEPSGSGEPSTSSSGEPSTSGGSGSGSAPGSGNVAQGLLISEQPSGSEQPADQPEEPSVPAQGGPAVLLLPDGSEQLVLLRTAQQEAEEAAAALAAAQRRQQEQAADAAALPTYQPPASREDEQMRRAISQADAALRQHQPAASRGQQPSDDWLERLRRADAALQAAVARNDAQRFDGGCAGGSRDGDSSSGD